MHESSRQLAAIMFTDIVGYTALMGTDSKKALELVRQSKDIQMPLVEKHNGKWLKEMGDGAMAQFSTALDAVNCALEIQRTSRADFEADLRIGINLGDITIENNDIYGDGVNVAARLESVADPGGIYISESIEKAIRGQSDVQAKYLGEFNLKNVDYQLKTYSLQGEGLPVPTTAKIKKLTGKGLKERIVGSASSYIVLLFLLLASGWWIRNEFFVDQSTITSLVILPLDNFTGSDESEYYIAGMHESLITDIGQIGALRIISKTTANSFKDTEKSITEIASELKVDGAIEGSFSCLGEDSVCVLIRLVSAIGEEQQLWEQDYIVAKSQILNFYKDVTKKISEEIGVILTPQEENLLAETRTVDPEAYDAYMKAKYYYEQATPDGFQQALEYLNLAIEKDPSWAIPYAGIAEYWIIVRQAGMVPPSTVGPVIQENINKALEMDLNSAYIHYVNAMNAWLTEWDWEKSEREFLKAQEINPNNASYRSWFSHLLMILGRTDEAYEQGKLSLELDPLNPLIKAVFGAVLFERGDYDAYLSLTKKIPNNIPVMFFRERVYYAQGDYQNSFAVLIQYLQLLYLDKETIFDIQKTYEEEGYKAALENIVSAMEEKAQNSFVLPFDLIWLYRSELNKPERTLELLEKAFEIRDPSMPYISTNIYGIDYVRDNPRFIELLKKMNLPLH